MSPTERDWEVRKWKLVFYAIIGKLTFYAMLTYIVIWGQQLATTTKLNLIFGSGLIIMTSMMAATFRIYTGKEVKRNYWVPMVIGCGMAICIWMLYSVQVSPPSL